MSLARSRMTKSFMPLFLSSIASAMPPKPQPMMMTGTCLLSLLIADCIQCCSLRLDFRFLGHAAIEFIVAPDLVAKGFGRSADKLEVALADEVLHLILGKHAVEGIIEAQDGFARRVARRHDALPADKVVTWNGLGDGRDFLEVAGGAVLAGDPDGAQPALLHSARRRAREIECGGDLAALERGERLG